MRACTVSNLIKADIDPCDHDAGDAPTLNRKQRLSATIRGRRHQIRSLLSKVESAVSAVDGWVQVTGDDFWFRKCETTIHVNAPAKTVRHCENILREHGV